MSFNGWKEGKFKEIAVVTMGQSPKGSTCNKDGHGIALLNGPTEFGEQYPTPVQFTTDPKKISKMGDLLFCVRGSTVGRMNWSNDEYAIGRGLAAIRPKVAGNEYFVKGMIDLKLNSLIGQATGSTFPNVSRQMIEELTVMLPPVEEQKAIANILSSLDEKIELNNQMNKTLEEMAQVLFKRWFVDFEFPNEDGEPYKSSGGEMVDSELGMIPKGWKVKQLQDVAQFQNGFAFYKIGYSEYGIKVIDLANVNILGNFVETNRDKYISFDIYNQEKMNKFKLVKNDLIMIMTDRTQDMNILGKTAKVPYSDRYILNQRVGRIRANKEINENYLMSVLNSQRVLDGLKKKSLGSVQRYVNTNHIKEIEIIIATERVMNRYSDKINPLFEQMYILNEQNLRLQELRDTLLPKLMSGEIRVTDLQN